MRLQLASCDSQHQNTEQYDRQHDPQGQCFGCAVSLALVRDQKNHAAQQTEDDSNERNDGKYFDRHDPVHKYQKI